MPLKQPSMISQVRLSLRHILMIHQNSTNRVLQESSQRFSYFDHMNYQINFQILTSLQIHALSQVLYSRNQYLSLSQSSIYSCQSSTMYQTIWVFCVFSKGISSAFRSLQVPGAAAQFPTSSFH